MAKNLKKLVLLHSNDMHGDFLAEHVDENLVGGVSMLSGYVSKVRAEEENVLYCIAGDMFRGSVIDSDYKGLSTIQIMNLIAPDIATIGNHETDYGVAHLLFIEKCASFPIVNANLHIRLNGARLFSPCKVIEVGGMKVLFIGILTEQVISQTKQDGIIGSVVDIEDAAKEIGRICDAYRSTDIDFTVLLTHIGFEEDKALAAILDPEWGVDVIIGGHSHTFLKEPAVVNGIPIVQAGTGTDQIGRFDIMIDTDLNTIDSYTWTTIPINAETCPRDEVVEEHIRSLKTKVDEKYGRIVTHFKRELTHPKREQETEIGDVFAEGLRHSLGVDIAFVGSGSIRNPKCGPIVTLGDLNEVFPYNDPVYLLKVTGAQLRRMLRYMCRDDVWAGVHNEFFQFSDGVRFVYYQSLKDFTEFSLNGRPIQDDDIITISLGRYHYNNFEEDFNVPLQEVEKNGKGRVIATSDRSVLEEYLQTHQQLGHDVDGRLEIHLGDERP